MFGWRGGLGIAVYGGVWRRRVVSRTMSRTGRVRTDATPESPVGEAAVQELVCRPRGRGGLTRLAVKQFRFPEPLVSARSARPLPVTTFWETRLPCWRRGGLCPVWLARTTRRG